MITTLLRVAALGALLLLAACDRQTGPAAAPIADMPKNLRVYTVPADRAEGLRDALARSGIDAAPADAIRETGS